MKQYLIHLTFNSPVHFGLDEKTIGIEVCQPTIHSDTLFSAICNAWSLIDNNFEKDKNDLNTIIKAFKNDNPPFKISSTFFYRNKKSYYLPKPLFNPFDLDKSNPKKESNIKKYKKVIDKIPYITFEQFKKWIDNQEVFEDIAYSEEKYTDCFYNETKPRRVSDSITNASTIYHMGMTRFAEESGLYFILQIPDEDIFNINNFKSILKIVGKNGVGGRRSLGLGYFDFNDEDIEDIPENSDWRKVFREEKQDDSFFLLSLYYPENNNFHPVFYNLIPRKGWTFSSTHFGQFKRKTCFMFSEGSIFKSKPVGKLVNVTPESVFIEHDVYKYGYALSIPINIKKDNLL